LRRPGARRFDPFLGDADLRRAYRSLLDGRWAELELALRGEAGGWLLRSILTSDDAAIETVVFRRLAEAASSGAALALLGGAQVRDAWSLVAGAGGPVAGRDQLRVQLTEAEAVLEQAAMKELDLADPWVHLLSSGRGLRMGVIQLRDRFEQAQRLEPFRPDACREYLLGLRRGGGNDPGLFDFARWVEEEAPPGSPAREVLPRAHLEFATGLAPRESLTTHLARPETRDELAAALSSFLEATPVPARPVDLATLNAYGLAMTISDAQTARLTRECFRRIGNRPTSYPWSLYPGEGIAAVFTEVQRVQLRSADRYAPSS
jgi:hypothetical protein